MNELETSICPGCGRPVRLHGTFTDTAMMPVHRLTEFGDRMVAWHSQCAGDTSARPIVSYDEPMDWLIYLGENLPYRADPLIPNFIDVLWHPQEDRIIGIKIWDANKYPNGPAILHRAGFTDSLDP